METTKTARGYWKERFGEYPKNAKERLACTMMREYHSDQSTSQKETIERLRELINWAINQDDFGSISGRAQFLRKAEQLLSTTEPIDQNPEQ